MSEEKIGGAGVFEMFLIIGIIVVAVCGILLCGILFYFVAAPKATIEHSTNLTIEHLWEDDSEYYFADSEGVVYKIGSPQGQVMYETMPKTRFGKLKEGGYYQIEYTLGWEMRFSISEKEMVI